ncbi:gfo/Idh/MocA family oxidoreductase [Alphaproteobacteria bacterium HT1-32]|nr:gfo/Idh/MocA family oxidoreductase [Alphaproteobacteria bacterium HT1-32]
MINAAIVGLGRWGQKLVDSVQTADGPKGDAIKVTRAVTRTPSKVEDYCKGLGITLSDRYEDALEDSSIDAVILATPHSQHADQIVAAAAAGKQIFVEKPFTLNRADAVRAAEACAKAGVVCALGHNRRFLPAMQEIRQMIDSDTLGQMLQVEANFSGNGALRYKADMWRANGAEESPVGGMTGMGVHMIDSMVMMYGHIEAVRTVSKRQVVEVNMDDTSVIMLEFRNGRLGTLTTLAATQPLWRIQFMGVKGWVQLSHHTKMESLIDGVGRKQRDFDATDIERAELEAFAAAASGGAAYPLPVEDAVHNAAVLEAIIASAKQNGERVVVAG